MEGLEKNLDWQNIRDCSDIRNSEKELGTDLSLEENPLLRNMNDENIKINIVKSLKDGKISYADIQRELESHSKIISQLDNPELFKLYNKLKTSPNNYIPSRILQEFDAHNEIGKIETESIRDLMQISLNAGCKPTYVLTELEWYEKLVVANNATWKKIAIDLLKQWRSAEKAVGEYEAYIDIENEENLDVKELMVAFIKNNIPPSWIDDGICRIIVRDYGQKYGHEMIEMLVDKITTQNISEQDALHFAHTYTPNNI